MDLVEAMRLLLWHQPGPPDAERRAVAMEVLYGALEEVVSRFAMKNPRLLATEDSEPDEVRHEVLAAIGGRSRPVESPPVETRPAAMAYLRRMVRNTVVAAYRTRRQELPGDQTELLETIPAASEERRPLDSSDDPVAEFQEALVLPVDEHNWQTTLRHLNRLVEVALDRLIAVADDPQWRGLAERKETVTRAVWRAASEFRMGPHVFVGRWQRVLRCWVGASTMEAEVEAEGARRGRVLLDKSRPEYARVRNDLDQQNRRALVRVRDYLIREGMSEWNADRLVVALSVRVGRQVRE